MDCVDDMAFYLPLARLQCDKDYNQPSYGVYLPLGPPEVKNAFLKKNKYLRFKEQWSEKSEQCQNSSKHSRFAGYD
jgi:hypothetical protein